jgi:hypothetical protein
VADLFEAYVADQKASGKSSGKEAEKGFNKVADTLGRNRPARDIETDEFTESNSADLRSRQAVEGGSRPQLHPIRV